MAYGTKRLIVSARTEAGAFFSGQPVSAVDANETHIHTSSERVDAEAGIDSPYAHQQRIKTPHDDLNT